MVAAMEIPTSVTTTATVAMRETAVAAMGAVEIVFSEGTTMPALLAAY